MPVFVEWRWKEKTKSFLVIFHFYDDFSKPNLRIRKYESEEKLVHSALGDSSVKEAWMTWSPSHLELALLSELLCHANMINGLKEYEKRNLIPMLEGVFYTDTYGTVDMDMFRHIIGKDKRVVVYVEEAGKKTKRLHMCVELCQEYVDVVNKLLKGENVGSCLIGHILYRIKLNSDASRGI